MGKRKRAVQQKKKTPTKKKNSNNNNNYNYNGKQNTAQPKQSQHTSDVVAETAPTAVGEPLGASTHHDVSATAAAPSPFAYVDLASITNDHHKKNNNKRRRRDSAPPATTAATSTAGDASSSTQGDVSPPKQQRTTANGGEGNNLPPARHSLASLYGHDATADVVLRPVKNAEHVVKTKDLQDLIQWVLCNGNNPSWIFVKNKPLISCMVVVMLRSVGEQLYTKYSSCFSSLKLQKDGGAFSQMAPFSSPGSKYRVFETLYALLAVQKQSKSSKKSLKRKRESLPNALLIPGDVKASFKKFKQSHEPSPSSEKENKEDEEGTIVLNITSTSSSSPSSPSSSSSSKSKCSFLEPFILTMAQLKQNKFPLENYPPPKLQNITDKEEEEEEEEAEEEGNKRGAEEEKEQKETTNPYEGYVSTKSSRREAASSSATPSGPRLLAIDCEMCLTAKGSELTRCSVIDDSHNVLYDELVLPDSPIIDYLTKYSGITAEKLEGVTTRLKDVQEALLSLITPDTVLVGHSLENDLTALKLFHDRIIDTSVLYPHPTEPEMKQSLRFLVQKYLRRNIQQQQLQQTSAVGHDSVEDAIACMELAQLKIIRGTHFGSAFEEAAVLSGNHNANNNGLNSEGIKTLFSVLQKHNNQTLMVDRNYVLRKYLPLVPPVDQVPLSSPLPSPPLEEEWKISGKRKGKKQLIPVVSVACLNNDDEEITEKLVSKLEHLQQVPDQPKTFLLSQLHAIEDHLSGKDLMREKFKANVQKQQQQLPEQKQKENEETQGEENGRHLEEEDREEALKSKLRQLDNNIKRIYAAMPQNGLLIVCPAREHLDAVCRLQKQKQQEGSNWTQEQDVELANSVAAVRNGLAFFTVKQTCDTP